MSYFSRLTDIVTCNLGRLLAEADDPGIAIDRIIAEIKEGLAGAKRSVATALQNKTQLAQEIEERRAELATWTSKAKLELGAGKEDRARQALLRKQEIQDLIAGLEQQHQAAAATREHLETMLRAIEARLAEATRKQEQLAMRQPGNVPASASPDGRRNTTMHLTADELCNRRIDAELESLKRELAQEG